MDTLNIGNHQVVFGAAISVPSPEWRVNRCTENRVDCLWGWDSGGKPLVTVNGC
jgi:hypothetical protein